MAPRRTVFNIKWKNVYPWLNSVPNDEFKAYCKLCKRIFSISGKGEGCVKEHALGEAHRNAEGAVANTRSLHHFFTRKLHHWN